MLLKFSTLTYVFVAICMILGISMYVSRHQFSRFDATLKSTFANASDAKFYDERVETTLLMQGSRLQLVDLYRLDRAHNRYYSISTTTLIFANSKPSIVFSVSNISLGQDLYTKVGGVSNAQLSVPSDNIWRHFTISSIPRNYENIAVSGAILDNLKLFERAGEHLIQIATYATSTIDGKLESHYLFKLSSSRTAVDPVIQPTMSRLGSSGKIDIWIDSATQKISTIVFHNESYFSTTTIDYADQPFSLATPSSAAVVH